MEATLWPQRLKELPQLFCCKIPFFLFSPFEFSKVNVPEFNIWIVESSWPQPKNVLMGRANHILVKYVHDCNLLSTFIGCNSFKFAFLFAFLKRGALLKTTSYDSLYRSEQYFLAKTFCLKVFFPKNAVELKNSIQSNPIFATCLNVSHGFNAMVLETVQT